MQITSISFDESGLCLATGSSSGLVAVYDVRSSRPLQTKKHQYEVPIKSLRFHRGPASGITSATSQLLASADQKILKIWYKDSVRRGAVACRLCPCARSVYRAGVSACVC